jgi:hypothetical protein
MTFSQEWKRRFKKTCISVLSTLPMGISSDPIHDYVRCMTKQTECLLQANPHLIVFNHSLRSTEHSQQFAPQLRIVTANPFSYFRHVEITTLR